MKKIAALVLVCLPLAIAFAHAEDLDPSNPCGKLLQSTDAITTDYLYSVTPPILRDREPGLTPQSLKEAVLHRDDTLAGELIRYVENPKIMSNPQRAEELAGAIDADKGTIGSPQISDGDKGTIGRPADSFIEAGKGTIGSPVQSVAAGKGTIGQAQLGNVSSVYENLKLSLALLSEYDSKFNTNFAGPAGLVVLQGLEPNPQNHHNSEIFYEVTFAVKNSSDPLLAAKYFSTLLSVPSIAGFAEDYGHFMPDLIGAILHQAQSQPSEMRPNSKEVARLLFKYIAYNATQSETVPYALKMAQVAVDYFSAIADHDRERFFLKEKAQLQTPKHY